jgi:hypothetical protein
MVADPQRTAWLDARRSGLGGTDIARLFTPAKSRPRWLGTPLDVYADKILDPVDLGGTGYQNRGRFLERAVLDWYQDQVERTVCVDASCWLEPRVVSSFPVMLRGDNPWELASPDGAVALPGVLPVDAEWGVDAKTSRPTKGWGEPLSDQVPMHIGLQMHWYMTVTGLPRWDIAVYFPIHDRFDRYVLMRNEAICTALREKAAAWWQTHIVGRVPPEITPSDSDGVERLFPANSGKAVEKATAAEERMLEEMSAARLQLRSSEHRETAAQIAIKAALGTRYGIEGKAGRVTWGTTARGRRFVFEANATTEQE